MAGCLSLLAAELGLRLLLFGEHPKVVQMGRSLRQPYRYTSYNTPEFWKLRTLFAERPQAIRTANRKHPHFHPLLGTRRKIFSPELEHQDESGRAGRRPVLLFGDSFGQCVMAVEKCWEDLLADSELGESHYLLNYGVGSYGFDQITLMLESVLPLYIDENPIIIVSLLVDDDIDRCYLPMRTYPKPFYEVRRDGAMVLQSPEHVTPFEYIADNPPAIRSYLARYVLYALPGITERQRYDWTGHGAHLETKQEIARQLFARIHGLLDGAGVDYFFALFHGPQGVDRQGKQWEDVLLHDLLQAEDVPYVSSESYLRRAIDAEGTDKDAYFLTEGSGAGHYNDRGNEVVFQGLLEALKQL